MSGNKWEREKHNCSGSQPLDLPVEVPPEENGRQDAGQEDNPYPPRSLVFYGRHHEQALLGLMRQT